MPTEHPDREGDEWPPRGRLPDNLGDGVAGRVVRQRDELVDDEPADQAEKDRSHRVATQPPTALIT